MRRTLPFALLACLLALTLRHAGAAPEEFDARDHRRLFAVRDTNAARHAIAEARQALAAGQTLRGLRAAQRVLDTMTDDFFLEEGDSTIESVLWRSAPEVVREVLQGLDDAQHQAYEDLTGPLAAPLLARSVRLREEGGLREVVRRYGASASGHQAALLLAEIALEAGRWRDAARYLQEDLRFRPRNAGLWTRLVDALAASGDRRALEGLAPPADLSTGSAADGPVAPTAHLRAALASLPESQGPVGWPMWGGVPARNASLPDETPMPQRLRWVERTDLLERRQDRVRVAFGGGGAPAVFHEMLTTLRPLHPVVDGRTVFVADGRSVRAYDLYSGRRAWVFDAHADTRLELAEPGTMAPGRTSLGRAFSPVVAGDLVIATVEIARPYNAEYLQGIEISSYLPRRILVALDRESGALRWAMAQDGVERLALATTSIVSVPVVAEGLVLAIGSVHGDVHNVSFLAFDLRSGALRWQRPLGFGQQELNLFGAPVKELAASPVTVADGVAYASTGLGFVAAVDIRSGIPRWLASYEISPVAKVQLWYDAPLRTPKIAPSPPVVQGDVLVVAPTDGLHVHAFDRRTGRLLWREPYQTNRMVYDVTGHFLGVVNDGRRDVVLLTDHELRARELATGRTVWRGRFDPEADRVIGRGAVADGEVLVPTSAGLQRFALRGDGAYRGTVPWPEDAEPGNLLPLARVLLVTSRDTLQWFYDWAAIERDVQRRRREAPDDPTILLEAGDMYLRGGGETERARKAFEEALRVAGEAQPAAAARALRGLFATWIVEGDQAAALPTKALAAYRRALAFARAPEDAVQAHLRIHRVLGGDAAARIRNLEALVEVAGKASAVFDANEGEVPARAGALFALAQEHLRLDHPADAVDALQQVLREEGQAAFPEGTGRERARNAIEAILAQHGATAYQRHERKARELLRRAKGDADPSLIEQLLREYPNASVMPDALLAQGQGLIEAGRAREAADYLRRLLADAPAHPLVPAALAGLARAYRLVGARGAARFALSQLARRHARAHLRWDGRESTGAAFVAAETALLGQETAPAEAPGRLRAPLRELAFEPVGDDEYARPVTLETDATGEDGPVEAPLALMMRGRELVAIDLRQGRVAWDADTGHCQRAVYAEGTLVVAVSRELRGLDAADGTTLWSLELEAVVRDLQVARGQVFALVQDLSGLSAQHRLLALDAFRGEVLWSVDLGREDYRDLKPWRDQVLLKHMRVRRGRASANLLVFDGFSGVRRHTLPLPWQQEGDGIVAGGFYVVAGRSDARSARALTAFDLEEGEIAWHRPLKGTEKACALVEDGHTLVMLASDGTVTTYGLKDGMVLHETGVFVGTMGRPCPFPGTPLLVDKRALTLFPWARKPALSVVRYDRRTGKLTWEAPYPEGVDPRKAVLFRRDGLLGVMISFSRDRVQHILLRLLDGETGAVLQEIEPQGLSKENWIPSLVEGHGTVVVFGKSGASIFRGDPEIAGR